MNQLHSTAFEASKLQSSFLRKYLTRNPEETILVDSEVVVLWRNPWIWKILDYFLLYFESLVYIYILVSGFSVPLLEENFWLVCWFGVFVGLLCFFKRKNTECLHYLNPTSCKSNKYNLKNTPYSCRPGYKTCNQQVFLLSLCCHVKAVCPSIIWVPRCVKRWWRVYRKPRSGSGGSVPKTGAFYVCGLVFLKIFFFLLVVQLQLVIKYHPTSVKLKTLFTGTVFLKLFWLILAKLCLDFCSLVCDWREGWLINAHIGGQGEAPLHLWGWS